MVITCLACPTNYQKCSSFGGPTICHVISSFPLYMFIILPNFRLRERGHLEHSQKGFGGGCDAIGGHLASPIVGVVL